MSEMLTYADAGVSIKAQNKVNEKIKASLNELGLKSDGQFGGAIGVSETESTHIGISCASMDVSIDSSISSLESGKGTLKKALENMPFGAEPIASLDYIAGPNMDDSVVKFATGVAIGSIENGVPIVGGESAQMPGSYLPKGKDVFVHLIHRGRASTNTIDIAPYIEGMEQPLLVASTDGTGTKTDIVRQAIDITAHGSNDISAVGAKPIAAAFYVAGNVSDGELMQIAKDAAYTCDDLGISCLDIYVEHKPDVYAPGKVDIAGTLIGVVDAENLITGENVVEGNVIVGLATDGIMTNGYSLARKVKDKQLADCRPEEKEQLENDIITELSRPHVIYRDILFGADEKEGIFTKFNGKINATAHITGGGQKDNIERMVPGGLCAEVEKGVLHYPKIIDYMKPYVDDDDLFEAFNMGVGFTVTVDESVADEVVKYVNDNFRYALDGVDRQAAIIGQIKEGSEKFRYKPAATTAKA